MIHTRGSQDLFIDTAVSVLESRSTKKAVMVAPVAYGKSICIANIVARLNAPTIIIQPSKELLIQNYNKFTSYGYTAAIYSASLGQREFGNVIYATIGSIKKEAATIKALGVKYIIIDECHLGSTGGAMLSSFIKDAGIKNVLGVTATPIVLRSTMEGAMLKMMDRTRDNLFSTISHVVQIKEMISSKYWSKLQYDIRVVTEEYLKYNSTGSEFTIASQLKLYCEAHIEEKCRKAVVDLRHQGRKSILVFVPTVEAAISLSTKINRSAVVHAKLKPKDRDAILNDFKDLKIDVVINVEILTTGFDHPELDAIVMARPTASIALYYQILGRLTRIHPNKKDGMVIDLSGNVTRFGIIEDLNYEYIDGYGWGLFTKDKLLTHHPIKAYPRPTKETLRKYASEAGGVMVSDHGKVKLFFGKHNGKTLEAIPISYLTFMLENFDFNSVRMKEIKNSIEIFLKLK